MSTIVGIHGIANQFRGPESLAKDWLPALNDGLNLAGSQKRVSPEDFSCAFFGDLFREDITKGFEDDTPDQWEEEMVLELWRAACVLDPKLPSPEEQTKGAHHKVFQMGLRVLVGTPLLGSLATSPIVIQAIFRRNLRQVRQYLFDMEVRRAAQDRLLQAVTENTRIIVAHSLGTVVAYEALFSARAKGVNTFITMGSPLGIRRMIFDRLIPTPKPAGGIWPGEIREWHNLADPNDIVALRKQLAPIFEGAIKDSVIKNGSEPHSAERYLNSQACGTAIDGSI